MTALIIYEYDSGVELTLKEFIRVSVSDFVRNQTQRAGWTPEFQIHGYTIKDLISFGHLIPVCDLFRILNLIDENATMKWSLELQIQAYKIRKKQTLH